MNLAVAFPPAIQAIVDETYPPARQALAEQLSRVTHPLYFVFTIFELALLLCFYYSGLSTRLRAALERAIPNPLLSAAAFIAVAFVALSVVMLPLTFYGDFIIAHEFRLSDETVGRWLRDWAVAVALSTAILAPAGAVLLRLIARSRIWPLLAAAGAAIFLIVGNAIFPLFIAPLFNRYTPLPPSPLTRSILALAASQGINASVVYEFDMSVQTNEVNAYVSGLGRTERIALADTTLASMRPDEVLFVMAHEMGHYKLGHLWILTAEAWGFVVVGILLVATLGAWFAKRDPRLARGLADPAVVPLLAVLILVYQLASMPAENALSRNIEHAADAFAGKHADAGDVGVRAQARLASIDLAPLHPNPLWVWFFYTHPPADQRIMDAARAAHLVP
ncbi:MAG TPA: M48 family metallopeptidase [Candidatus Acidoferrales bacterium]|nr:M48 family metallopeptidase [Candidatus Acidoferrales bacterium]